ncbi:MAG TPA: ABC transporter ATP-binding protein [Candidatus Binatus sp.]|uniref:ABC transporter ATP-binding protein n=1 Tax=Candidatus Binatus sp. TaxID=2811406 RepID=UPI002B46EE03|nr:ABC transporter ATP-binding protein [Candidatus Binatus sp.]HKN12593.1 ABC transporter ATP-binding protein [Candidatus Binatus sp.]
MQVVEENPLARIYDAGLVRWVWQFIRPYQGLFWLATFLMPLDTAFLLAQPYVIKLTVDEFLSGAHGAPPPAWLAILFRASGGHGLFVMGALYLLLVICEFAAFYAQFYLMMMVAQFSLSDLRMALFRKVERLPMSFFDHTPVGRLVSRMTTDIDSINDMFSAGSLTIFIDAMTLAGIVTIMFSLSPRLALSALCAIPPLTLVIYFLSSRSRIVYGQIRDRLAALNAYLSESLAGMMIVQLFTRERESRREFDTLNLRSRDVQMMANVYEAAQFSSVEALSSITVAVILWIGGGSVIRHLVTLGTLVAFIQYAQQFFMPLRDISTKYSALQSALAAVEKIHALMEGEQALALPAQPKRPAVSRGSIVFDHVNFEYRPGEPILKDLSFTVAAGRKIAIVGPTGSGKTTIIKLLNRSYDVTSGRILVDGVDVREWDLAALRREIGYVQQDVFLFAGDVMENIRLGLELGESEVRDALRRAQALRFVERLPGGLAEEIRERGANLSAGQRQLLSFARALAYNPRILVMDEATSSVDSETERLIQLALNELLAERTAVVIAHRLSTIERADRIMVLGGGVLRESGTHDELLAQRGLYYRLFELQYAAMANSDRLVAG